MKDETFSIPPGGDMDRGWALLSVKWAIIVLAIGTTVLRIWVRVRLTRNIGWDDYNIIAAMLVTLVGSGSTTASVLNGLGRHEYYLTPVQRERVQLFGWIDWVQTFLSLMFTKISICLFLLRIIPMSRIRRVMYGLIGCLAVFSMTCVLIFFGICRPLDAYWINGREGTCLSNHQIESVVIAQGVLSIITDAICALFPILVFRTLKISMRTKVGLCILMGLGFVTVICCTVRTALSGDLSSTDVSWATIPNLAWRIPEVDLGIVCANAPALRPLYLHVQGRLHTQRAERQASRYRIWPSDISPRSKRPAKSEPFGQEFVTELEPVTTSAKSVELGLPIQGALVSINR